MHITSELTNSQTWIQSFSLGFAAVATHKLLEKANLLYDGACLGRPSGNSLPISTPVIAFDQLARTTISAVSILAVDRITAEALSQLGIPYEPASVNTVVVMGLLNEGIQTFLQQKTTQASPQRENFSSFYCLKYNHSPDGHFTTIGNQPITNKDGSPLVENPYEQPVLGWINKENGQVFCLLFRDVLVFSENAESDLLLLAEMLPTSS